MTPHKQLVRHRPENGEYGDCYRTAIACLLDLHPSEVPHFVDDPKMTDEDLVLRVRAWLAGRGFSNFSFPVTAETPDQAMEAGSRLNPSTFWMLTGRGGAGVNHVVIVCDGKIAWDPSPGHSGILGPCVGTTAYWIEIIIPLSQVDVTGRDARRIAAAEVAA